MPTGEPKARYTLPHTTDTGRIRTASRTRSAFFWRSSSSSSGSAPIRASRASTVVDPADAGSVRDRDGAVDLLGHERRNASTGTTLIASGGRGRRDPFAVLACGSPEPPRGASSPDLEGRSKTRSANTGACAAADLTFPARGRRPPMCRHRRWGNLPLDLSVSGEGEAAPTGLVVGRTRLDPAPISATWDPPLRVCDGSPR